MPEAVSWIAPFVAIAPVVAVDTCKSEPLVRPVPVEAIRTPTPVVSAFPLNEAIVPAVVLFAETFKRPTLLVEV